MKNIFLILSTILFYSSAAAQQDINQWRVGAYGGVMGYYGDLSNKWVEPNDQLLNLFDNTDYISYGFSLEKSLSRAWGLRLLYSNGQFIANDRAVNWNGNLQTGNDNFSRALNVKTELTDWSVLASFYFDNDKWLSKNAFVAPFISAGIGWSDFKTYGDLYFEDGGRYHYWSDGTIRNKAEASGEVANIIEQDGVFETELQPLKTEGKNYSSNLFHATLGLGFKFRLGSRFNLNLESLVRYTNTDFLDDVSGKYLTEYASNAQEYAARPGSQSGTSRGNDNNANDLYYFTSLSLHYNFGRKKEAINPPVIRIGQLSTLPAEKVVQATDVMLTDTATFYVATVMVDSAYLVKEIEEDRFAGLEIDTIAKVGDQIFTFGQEKLWDEESENWELIQNYLSNDGSSPDSLNPDQMNADTQILYIMRTATHSIFAIEEKFGKILWEDEWENNIAIDTFYQVGNEIFANDFSEPISDEDWKIVRDDILEIPDSIKSDLTYEAYMESMIVEEGLDTIPSVIEEKVQTSVFEPIKLEKVESPAPLIEETEEDISPDELKTGAASSTTTQDEQEKRISELERKLDALILLQADTEKAANTALESPVSVEPPKEQGVNNAPMASENTATKKSNQQVDPELEKMKLQLLLMEQELNKNNQPEDAGQANKAAIDELKKSIATLQAKPVVVAPASSQPYDQDMVQLKSEMANMNQSMDLMKQLLIQQQTIEVLKNQPSTSRQISELEKEVAELKAKQAPTTPPVITPPVIVEADDENKQAMEAMSQQIALLQQQLEAANQPAANSAPANPVVVAPKVVNRSSLIRGRERQVVFFGVGSSALTTEGLQQVQSVSQLMLQHDDLNVSLEAYTDASGNAEKNLALSKKRAESVSQMLQQAGVVKDRIILDYRGEDLQSNPAYGRRVEIKLYFTE